LTLDEEPRVVVEPADFLHALDTILPPAPPMTGCPTATGGNTFALLKARRSPRRACDGLRRPWRTCEIPSRRKPEPPPLVEATAFPLRFLARRRGSCRLRHPSRVCVTRRPSAAADR
jgi:hypothetical protein